MLWRDDGNVVGIDRMGEIDGEGLADRDLGGCGKVTVKGRPLLRKVSSSRRSVPMLDWVRVIKYHCSSNMRI